jgi:hypothetical protein
MAGHILTDQYAFFASLNREIGLAIAQLSVHFPPRE